MATVVIGISGPSSSGKTTLARLLQSVFSGVEAFRSFIIHEDDFYYPDDKIPWTTTSSGRVQDWDTAEAIDLSFLSSSLRYVREHGSLPPVLKSKEDLNEASDSGVSAETILRLKERVSTLLSSRGNGNETGKGKGVVSTMALLEGFLLFSPPESERDEHVLRPVHREIDLPIFLPAAYDVVKARREGRSGYVTIGPALEPPLSQRESTEKKEEEEGEGEVDLQAEDERPPQNFWVDPPGYVDDIVWPRYVRDHAWLLLPEGGAPATTDDAELVRMVGQGVDVRMDAGVLVAPGMGARSMAETLDWAVEEIVRFLSSR